MIQNLENRGIDVIIATPFLQPQDHETIFGCDACPRPPVNLIVDGTKTMLDLLMALDVFKSRTQCKKNWKGPWEIPAGFSEFIVGKLRKSLAIWNPTE